MGYTTVALKEKIMEMYPEVGQQQVSVGLVYDAGKNAYVVSFSRGAEVLTTHLEKRDADECMNGIKCVYLGIQIAQFISNFAARKRFSLDAA